MPTSTPTPVGRIEVTAWVSNDKPAERTEVTVSGKITLNGMGIPSVPMRATWYYKTTTPECTATTGNDGVASCTRNIGGATKNYTVKVVIIFTYQNQAYTATTGFTPQ